MTTARNTFKEYRIFFVIYLLIIVVIVAISAILLSSLKKSLIKNARERLEYISRYKSEEITNWMHEREGDATVILRSHQFPAELNALMDDPGNESKQKDVLAHFVPIKQFYRYEDIILADLTGRIYVSLMVHKGYVGPDSKKGIDHSIKINNLLFSDFYYCREHNRIHLDFYATLYHYDADSSNPRALVLFRVDPELFIYPLLQSWPVPSRTSETLLIRADNDSVVYLNELRHRKGTALRLKFPIIDPDLPAAMAARGIEDFVKGTDYRDEEVLAFIRKVQGTPWFMVSKTDASEVFQPMLIWEIVTGVTAIFLIMLTGLIMMLIINRRRRDHFENLYDLKVQKEALSLQKELEIQTLNAELEMRVVERTAQLKATNEELESFSYSVSHDLRAPLRSMDGFSQALLEDYSGILDDTGKRYLQRIRHASQRMAQLIDDLLKLSRIGRLKLNTENIDLSKLAGTICQEISEEFSIKVYEVKIADGLVAQGDRALLRICLNNILHNAFKFSYHAETPCIEFGSLDKEGSVVFFVRDNGAGFDMTTGNKLFGVFQRFHTLEEFPGNGVGLTLVQRIIHRHGGLVWAASEVGHGSTFFFTLPPISLDNL